MARVVYAAGRLFEARRRLQLDGGWLLRRRHGETEWTDEEDHVVRRKGWAWVDECERQSCWDETQGVVHDLDTSEP